MDLRTHLFNRRELVAIFIDVAPSMLLTDLALPIPAAAAGFRAANTANTNTHSRTNMSSSGTDVYTPPTTRFEVVRASVRSFVMQKERAAAHPQKVSFALFAVVADGLVELLPPTQAGSPLVEAALRKYLGRDSAATFHKLLGENSGGGGSGGGHDDDSGNRKSTIRSSGPVTTVNGSSSSTAERPFPFPAVSTVLKSLEAGSAMPERQGDADRPRHPEMDFLCVQGIALVSRSLPSASASAVNRGPKGSSLSSAPAGTTTLGRSSDVWLDLVSITPLTATTAATTAATAVAGLMDIPCTVITPVEFTGITHPGLAIGPALTALIATAHRHTGGGLPPPPRPVFMVELSPHLSTPHQQAVFSTSNTPSPMVTRELLMAAGGGGASASPAAPAFISRGSCGGGSAVPPLRLTSAKSGGGRGTTNTSTTLPLMSRAPAQQDRTPHHSTPLQGRAISSVLTNNAAPVIGTAAASSRISGSPPGSAANATAGHARHPHTQQQQQQGGGGGGGGPYVMGTVLGPEPGGVTPIFRVDDPTILAGTVLARRSSAPSGASVQGRRSGLHLRTSPQASTINHSSGGGVSGGVSPPLSPPQPSDIVVTGGGNGDSPRAARHAAPMGNAPPPPNGRTARPPAEARASGGGSRGAAPRPRAVSSGASIRLKHTAGGDGPPQQLSPTTGGSNNGSALQARPGGHRGASLDSGLKDSTPF